MRRTRVAAFAAVLFLGACSLAVPALAQRDRDGMSGGMMGNGENSGGMMGGGMMGNGGMMGRGGMGNMMDRGMGDCCAGMKGGGPRPNQQWRHSTPPPDQG